MRPTIDQPQMVAVLAVERVTADTSVLWLDHVMSFEPGQFVMAWLPGQDEKPYSISHAAASRIAITVRRRGPFSAALLDRKPGDAIGVRGPYGRGFSPKPPTVIVAGGCGLAPVSVLKDRCPDAVLIAGARTACEIMFRDRWADMLLCTDDGSEGHKGPPTDLLTTWLQRGQARTVCTCGPEPMMRAVFELCEKYHVECQAGLERYMKCGFGLCGQCACGDRLVCRDGPVFHSEDLRAMTEFGRMARLKSGRPVTIREYANWCSA